MAVTPHRRMHPGVAFVIGGLLALVLGLAWALWREEGRVAFRPQLPQAPDLPTPTLPDAPRIPDAPIPTRR